MKDETVKNLIANLHFRADFMADADMSTALDEGIALGYRTAANLFSGHLNEEIGE